MFNRLQKLYSLLKLWSLYYSCAAFVMLESVFAYRYEPGFMRAKLPC